MAEQLPLPRGWEIRYTENNKYFIDHNTQTTTLKGSYETSVLPQTDLEV